MGLGPTWVDHAVLAGPDRSRMEAAFERLGLPPAYGGRHSNGVTEMSVVGFADGNYLELISKAADEPSPLWDRFIDGNAGPTAWCVNVADLEDAVDRIADRGIGIEGPVAYDRERPDGVTVEFDLAFLGSRDPGAVLPFLIEDRTPRERRVTPTAGAEDSPLRGLAEVVVCVEDIARERDRLATAFDVSRPVLEDAAPIGESAVRFDSLPVSLVAGGDWVESRLASFGPSPGAYILAADAFDAARDRLSASAPVDWLGRRVAFATLPGVGGRQQIAVTPTSPW